MRKSNWWFLASALMLGFLLIGLPILMSFVYESITIRQLAFYESTPNVYKGVIAGCALIVFMCAFAVYMTRSLALKWVLAAIMVVEAGFLLNMYFDDTHEFDVIMKGVGIAGVIFFAGMLLTVYDIWRQLKNKLQLTQDMEIKD